MPEGGSSGATPAQHRRAAGHRGRPSYGSLLEGSVLTETVFAWPGLGPYITGSLLNADMNAVLGGTIVVGCVFIGLNLLSDLLYRLLDPRARHDAGAPAGRLARLAARRHAAPPRCRPGSASVYLAWLPFRATRWPWSAWPSCSCCSSSPPRAGLAPHSPIDQDLTHASAAVGRALVRHRRVGRDIWSRIV